MNSPVRFLPLIAIIASVIILTLIHAIAVSSWVMNIGNAHLSRAMSLPSDSPARTDALRNADQLFGRALIFSEQPRLALALAREQIANDDPQTAARILQANDSALHEDSIAQFVWGNAEWASSHREAAFAHWRNAGALKYFVEEAHRAIFRDDWSQVEDYARIAMGIAPADAESHFLLADALIHQSQGADEAMRELERAAQLIGDSDKEFLSTILSRQGEVLFAQGKYSQALDDFNRARQAAPIDARPRTDYARTILKINPASTSEAHELLTQVTTDSPWYVDAYILLAEISEKDGDLVQAENWYRNGLQKNPNDARLLFPLGEFYAQQNRIGEAKDTLILALKYETHPDILQAISRSLVRVSAK